MKYRPQQSWLAGLALALAACTVVNAAEPDSSPRFDIQRFDVRGNTLLLPAAIDALVAPYTGKQRDFGDVMAALEALESAYHARGYQLVHIQLPEQELNQGVVVLHVQQTKIGRITVEGNQYFDAANIRYALPALQEGQPPDLGAVSQSLKLANENPAKKVVMNLKSGAQDDAVDATLVVTDTSVWSTTLNLDNTGSDSTGKTHAGVVLQNANLFGRDHVLSLQYTTSLEKPSNVSVYGIGYHVPLYARGDSLDVFASYSDVDAGKVTAGTFELAISGKGATYGARYNHRLSTAGNYESKLVYGADYKIFKNTVALLGIDLGRDIEVHPLSLAYQGKWTLSAGEAGVDVGLLRNIPGGSHGVQQDFSNVRSNAVADYTALRFAASLTQALPANGLARAFINGQYTNDALIPGEQFGAGGAASVRGFDGREVSNDTGVSVNLEMYSPPLCKGRDWQCRVLAFYDAAYVARNHALPGELTSMTISSAGVGLRLGLGRRVDLQMDYASVLQAQATATRVGDARLHARLSLTF